MVALSESIEETERALKGPEEEHIPSQQITHRKQKRLQESDVSIETDRSGNYGKRARTSAVDTITEEDQDPIAYWTKHGQWPALYSESMSHLLARKKSETSLRHRKSDTSSAIPNSSTPSEEKPREEKSAPYARSSYASILATKGSFMNKSEGGIPINQDKKALTLHAETESTAKLRG